MIGKKLKLLRESNELTQVRMADLLQLNRVTYNRYENGERQPDYETLKKIADFFNVSTDYLLGRNEIISNEGQAEISPEDIELLTQIKKASPERERLIQEITKVNDADLREMEQILNYVKSKKTKNQDAATIETIA